MVGMGFPSGVILIVLGLAVAFLGKKLVKTVFFLIGGVVGALLTLMIAPMFLAPPYTYLLAVVGFVIVGLIFYLLLPFGAGLLAGVATFLLLRGFVDLVLAVILALIALIVVVILFNKILSVATAFLGSLIFVVGLGQVGVAPPEFLQLILIALITILGSIVQFKT